MTPNDSRISILINEQNKNDFAKFITALVHESAGFIGQVKLEPHIEHIAVQEFGNHIQKKYKSYSVNEIRMGLKYGYKQDQTKGGSIYAQRLIFWLDSYHKDVWLKKNQQAIHNGTFNKPVEPEKRLATSRNVSLEFIKDQQRKHLNGEFAMLAACYETLDRMGKIQVSTEAKWNIVKRACKNLLKDNDELNDLFKFRNLKKEVEAVEIGNNKTVTPRIKAECQRILVGDLFEIEEF